MVRVGWLGLLCPVCDAMQLDFGRDRVNWEQLGGWWPMRLLISTRASSPTDSACKKVRYARRDVETAQFPPAAGLDVDMAWLVVARPSDNDVTATADLGGAKPLRHAA